MYEALRPQRVSGGLDYTNFPTVLPVQAEGWTGAPRFVVTRDGHELFCHFTVTDVQANTDGAVIDKFSPLAQSLSGLDDEQLKQAQQSSSTYPRNIASVPQITVTAQDAEQGVQLVWQMQILEGGLVRQRATVSNTQGAQADSIADSILAVNTLELSYPVPAGAREILTTAGHHLRERHPQRQNLTMGRFERVAEVGRPDFDATLLLTVGARGFDFEHGEVFSIHVGWSGNSVTSVEETVYTLPLIGGGESLYAGEVELRAGSADSYTSPWVYGAYGDAE